MTNRTAAELESLIKFYDLQVARCDRVGDNGNRPAVITEMNYWLTLKANALAGK